jgi:hypothetical protein
LCFEADRVFTAAVPLISNNKFVACVASMHVATGTAPDVCKTPAPPAPAPIPIPYPNIAMSATMGPGYTTKTLSMGTPMWTKNGQSAISNGMQPGVALGLISNKIMGMAGIIMCSNDVEAEGGGVVRTLDRTTPTVESACRKMFPPER